MIHPRMLASLSQFYPSSCTIQRSVLSQDDYGEPTAVWSDLADHVDLACGVAPISAGSPTGANEYRRADLTVTTATHHIALAGNYPTITPAMRAVVDGVAWNILGVEHDSHGVTTRLKVERVQAP